MRNRCSLPPNYIVSNSFVTTQLQKASYHDGYFITFFVLLGVYISVLFYLMFFSKNPVLKRFAWGSSGGSITGMQNFLKDSLTIIKATDKGEAYPWFFYFFFAMAAATAFVGLLFLTACMKRYDATYSASSFVGSFVICASIMSAVHYHSFQNLEHVWNYILYPTGLIVLGIGVYMLVRESREAGEEDNELGSVFERPNRDRKNSEDSQVCYDRTLTQGGKCMIPVVIIMSLIPRCFSR